MLAPDSLVDQIVCDYDPANLAGTTGFGPLAASCPETEALSLYNVADTVMRPPPGRSAGDSLTYRQLASGDELIVRRVPAVDSLKRGGVRSHALVGRAGQFTAEAALGLPDAAWPLADTMHQVEVGDPLPRVDWRAVQRAAVAGAERIRVQAREDAVVMELLRRLTTWFLTVPAMRASMPASLFPEDPRPVLLGLVDLLGPLLPGPWTFSTLETIEADEPRLILMPEPPAAGSPEYGRERLWGQPAPDGPAHDAAAALVDHYRAYGREALRTLHPGPVPWQQMQPDQRATSLLGALAVQVPAAAGPALPPSGSQAAAVADETNAASGTSEQVSEADHGGAEGDGPPAEIAPVKEPPTGGAIHDDAAGGDAVPNQPPMPPAPTTAAPPRPQPPPPAATGAHQVHPGHVKAWVTWLLVPGVGHDADLALLQLESRADFWGQAGDEAACLTALHLRFGLVDAAGRRGPGRPGLLERPERLYRLLRGGLRYEEPAAAWAVFLRDESTGELAETIRAMARQMFAEHRRRKVQIHPAFFRVGGEWAIQRALGLDQSDPPTPQAGSPGLMRRFRNRKRRHRAAKPSPPGEERGGRWGTAADRQVLAVLGKVFVLAMTVLMVLFALAVR
ncbi:hypothetical protein [Streptomyces sp. WAC 04229]|uniref:hypothetical protein n=1 Tax=Streptomyces sp. WAC 04229 TaxID=2203206 RepID=UPI003D708EB8